MSRGAPDPARYERVRELLHAVADLEPAERARRLEAARSGDEELVREVERLLAADPVATSALLGGGPAPTAGPPRAVGRFRLVAELGRGGMGTVHEAHDGDGRRVAVKLLHPHLVARPEVAARFRREAEAGRRVDHPNVVRTLEVLGGERGEVDALVLEFVEGRTLRGLIDDLGTVPEGLVREIAQQAAAGLEAIHAAGVVHRDLKPENVLVTDDRRVRLMDFGVARVADRATALTAERQFVGSLAYAAPEQLAGGEAGPAADLYSLGVVLHEMATGCNPFRREHAGATLHAHLEEPPPPLADRAPEASPFLGAVVATLLAKRPEARFASAAELREVLAAGEAGAWWAERERGSVEALPRLPVDRAARLHGRARELAALRSAWAEARAGRGAVIHLEGEAGIGKTRLLDALVESLSEEPVHVLYGSYPPTGGRGALSSAILRRLGAHGLARALAARLGDAAAFAPGLAALVQGLPAPPGAHPLKPDSLPALCAALARGFARERPTLWIVDDLHYAPEARRAAVRSLARAAAGERLLVVLASRTAPPRPELEELSRLPRFERLALARLGRAEVDELLADLLGSPELAERIGSRVASRSEGVPFFLLASVRSLVDSGHLARDPRGGLVEARTVSDVEVPGIVRELVAARLSELRREERETLDAAAVLGHEFDAARVASLLARPLVSVLRDLAELERRHGLVRSVGREHRFDHHQVHEAVYAELPPALREQLHAELAELVRESRSPAEMGGEDCLFAALHHLRGARPDAAVELLGAAISHAAVTLRDDALESLVRLALERLPALPPALRTRVHLHEASLRALEGRRVEELAAAEAALRAAEESLDPRLRARALFALGAYHLFSDPPQSVERFLEALAVARNEGEPRDELEVLGGLLYALGKAGDFARLPSALDDYLAAARALGDRGAEGLAHGHRGDLFAREGRFEPARAELDRAHAILDAPGRRVSRLSVATVYVDVALASGRPEEAQRRLEETLLGRDVPMAPELQAATHAAAASLALFHGRLRAARSGFERPWRIGCAIGSRELEAGGLCDLARVAWHLGAPEDAAALAAAALLAARDAKERRLEAQVRLLRGTLRRHAGDPAAAQAELDAALHLARRIRDAYHEAWALLELGAAAAARGAEGDAEALLAQAAEIARTCPAPRLLVLSAAHAASLAPERLATAEALLAEHESRIPVLDRLEARQLCFHARGDELHLAEARRLLELVRAGAPEESLDALLRVPLHASVAAGERR